MTKRAPVPAAASEPTTAEATALQIATANLEAAQSSAELAERQNDLSRAQRDRLTQMAAELQPDVPQINLATRRGELVDARATALHQVHYLEGALNEIDYLIALLNPQDPSQPATNAEGETA